MNGLGKQFKNLFQKTAKIKVKLPHVNKITSEKANFCSNTVFSLLRGKNFTPQNHSLFGSTSCFGVTKTTTPI